jgi:hypothetical protein
MIEHKEFLMRLIHSLETADISYMLAGSIGSSFFGHPRSTNDIDVVIAPTESQLSNLVKLLEKDCYLSSETAQNALRDKTSFNVIDNQTGSKADLIIRKNRPFSHEEFRRRRRISIPELEIWILSPEDAILSKLEWMKGRESDVQYRDAFDVMMVQWDNLDWDYLHHWALALGVAEALECLEAEAKKQKGL